MALDWLLEEIFFLLAHTCTPAFAYHSGKGCDPHICNMYFPIEPMQPEQPPGPDFNFMYDS